MTQTYEQEFLADFAAFIDQQVRINELAMKTAETIATEDGDERAKEALIRYESKLDAYQFLQGKFANFAQGKSFHDLPDGLFGERRY